MRIALLISMLAALLLVAYLTVQSLAPQNGNSGRNAAITAIDKAGEAREKTDQAGRDLEKRLDGVLKE